MVAPGPTVKFAGWKAKFFIVTVLADADVTDAGDTAGEVVVLLLPQALTNNKVTIAANAARRWQETHRGAAERLCSVDDPR